MRRRCFPTGESGHWCASLACGRYVETTSGTRSEVVRRQFLRNAGFSPMCRCRRAVKLSVAKGIDSGVRVTTQFAWVSSDIGVRICLTSSTWCSIPHTRVRRSSRLRIEFRQKDLAARNLIDLLRFMARRRANCERAIGPSPTSDEVAYAKLP